MKMKIEITAEMADEIILASLRSNIDGLKHDIEHLKRKKKLLDYEKEDLADFTRTFAAMQEVYDYYGGNIE